MRKSRFTTEQIVGILKEQEAGAMISELCRRHGISDNTFHRWKRKYGGYPSRHFCAFLESGSVYGVRLPFSRRC
jgi:putative transposase